MYVVFLCILFELIKINKTQSQILSYTLAMFFFQHTYNTKYNLSFYYQLINLLNNKINLTIVVVLVYSIVCYFLKQGTNNYLKYGFISVYLNVVLGDVFIGNNYLISSSTTLNTNLLNGLMLIHPLILYIFYVFYLLEFKVNTFLKYKKIKRGFLARYKKIYLPIIIYLSIVLGCWWAEQELSWGG